MNDIALSFKSSLLAYHGHQWFPCLLLNEHFPSLGLVNTYFEEQHRPLTPVTSRFILHDVTI